MQPDLPYPIPDEQPQPLRCHYCGAVATFGKVGSRKSWLCSNFPACNSYVGSHPDGSPKGSLANLQLRRMRVIVHRAFDPLWTSGKMSRSESYAWLAGRMNMAPEFCHIAMFDLDLCQEALSIIQSYRRFENDEF